MNKKALEQLSDTVRALRANRFETLAEAAIFCAAACATAKGELRGVSEIGRVTQLPVTTVSRVIWGMTKRGMLEYITDNKDRRIRLVRANLAAFK
jgi:DNA-binding MarR family transcriptional regulator